MPYEFDHRKGTGTLEHLDALSEALCAYLEHTNKIDWFVGVVHEQDDVLTVIKERMLGLHLVDDCHEGCGEPANYPIALKRGKATYRCRNCKRIYHCWWG
jgi:hypothetical protein